jgi:glutaredoxin
MWQIPINKNAPYTPEKIRPLVPYVDEENVKNPCSVEDLSNSASTTSTTKNSSAEKVVIFHNNAGPMCLEALDFFEANNIEYEEHLTNDSDFTSLLTDYKSDFEVSEGESAGFGYYPIIFIGDKAYSGFNEDIGEEIKSLI